MNRLQINKFFDNLQGFLFIFVGVLLVIGFIMAAIKEEILLLLVLPFPILFIIAGFLILKGLIYKSPSNPNGLSGWFNTFEDGKRTMKHVLFWIAEQREERRRIK